MSLQRTICLIGQSGSGKSTLAELLASQYGYCRVNISDEVRKAAAANGLLHPTRKDLQLLANASREQYGNDYFARSAFTGCEQAKLVVFEGIRHPEELEYLQRSREGLFLVCGIEATQVNRFERVLDRARSSDPRDFAQFKENDAREWGVSGGGNSQNTQALMRQCDAIIHNDAGIIEFQTTADEFLEMYGLKVDEHGRSLVLSMQEDLRDAYMRIVRESGDPEARAQSFEQEALHIASGGNRERRG